MTSQLLADLTFSGFGLPDSVQRGLDDAGFQHCTMIQAQALPIALKGGDVAGQAQTGTGKTAAFLVVLFTKLLQQQAIEKPKPNQPRAIVIAPTRELAIQIHKDAQQLGRHTPFNLALVYGGMDYLKQRSQFESGTDILIGTPGRIIDYYKQRLFNFKALQVMVLDEADRMFDLGFIKDIRYLLRRMPQTGKTPQHAVFGNTLLAGDGTGLRAHEQPQVAQNRIRQCDSRQSRADHILSIELGKKFL